MVILSEANVFQYWNIEQHKWYVEFIMCQWRSQKFFTGVRNSVTPVVSNFQPTPFTVSVESGTLTGERVITCRTSSMET